MIQQIEIGSLNTIIVQEFSVTGPDRWLISYGRDAKSGMLLWQEIRFLTDEQRATLGKKLADAKVEYEMINLTAAERGEPWTIEEFLGDK